MALTFRRVVNDVSCPLLPCMLRVCGGGVGALCVPPLPTYACTFVPARDVLRSARVYFCLCAHF